MSLKQISVTIPNVLFEASREYSQEFGYRNLQELLLDLLRHKVLDKIHKYKAIEERMKKGIGVKKFDQKEAVKYLRGI